MFIFQVTQKQPEKKEVPEVFIKQNVGVEQKMKEDRVNSATRETITHATLNKQKTELVETKSAQIIQINKADALEQKAESLEKQGQTQKAKEVRNVAQEVRESAENPNLTLKDVKNLDKKHETLFRELGLWDQFQKWVKDAETKLNDQKNKVKPPSVPKATRDYNEKKPKKNADENAEIGKKDSEKGKTETSGQQYAENTQKKAKAPKIKKEETAENTVEKKVFTEQGPKQEN